MVTRPARVLAALVIALMVLVTGCGAKTALPPGQGPGSSSAESSLPPDPTGSGADAAPIDTSCPTSNTTPFAKTKFVAHLALGFGAFHRYLYKPFRAGTFSKGAKGRIAAFVKAGLAALFIKREIRLATVDVKANPTLCHAIAAPLGQLGDTLHAAVDKLKGGDASGITNASTLVSSIEDTAQRNGAPIQEDDTANIASNPK